VLEHTVLPVRRLQKYEDAVFTKLLWPLNGKPVGPYLVVVNGDPDKYRAGPDRAEDVRGRILAWIAEVGPRLQGGVSENLMDPAIGFDLSLHRLHPPARSLRIGRRARAQDDEASRALAESVRESMAKKLPKLFEARSNANCSVLLVEGDDISTASSWDLVPAIATELRVTSLPVPDLLFLIETSTERPYVTCVKHGEAVFDEAKHFGRSDENGLWPPLPLSIGAG
jgi:hypothetical protein